MTHHPRHRHANAQATIEMAMTLGIMLTLAFNFIAVMVIVKGQNQLQSALSLAAQSSLTAQVDDPYDACVYASRTFWSTIYAQPSLAEAGTTGSSNYCGGGISHDPFPWYGIPRSMEAQPPTNSTFKITDFSCSSTDPMHDYYTSTGINGPGAVTCTATQKFTLQGQLPFLATGDPTFTAIATATPGQTRQCNPYSPSFRNNQSIC